MRFHVIVQVAVVHQQQTIHVQHVEAADIIHVQHVAEAVKYTMMIIKIIGGYHGTKRMGL